MGIRYLKVSYVNLMQKLVKLGKVLWARISSITASWHLGRERVSVLCRFRLVCIFDIK